MFNYIIIQQSQQHISISALFQRLSLFMRVGLQYLKEMNHEYSDESDPNQNPDDVRPSFKRMTKNQQIYGDFEEAYEPELNYEVYPKKNDAYERFKAGSTIEVYTSEIEVDLPTTKPRKRATEQDEVDQKPMLGKFSLNSFLNNLQNNELQQILQDQNEDSSQNLPEGLNGKILKHLQLVKEGEETEEQMPELGQMNFQAYMKLNRPQKQKVEPKYKTEQEKELAKQFKDGYGIGFKMLEKMGFKVTKGLGRQQDGIQRPVQAVRKSAFTMKDEGKKKKNKEQQQSNSQKSDEEETKEQSIPQQLFQFRSKDKKINNFLFDLKNSFQKLQSQIYHCQIQIQSFNKEQQLNQSLRYQNQNQLNDLSKQINKLQQLEKNIYNGELHPHLGLHYKLDLLYVRQLYDDLLNSEVDSLRLHGAKKISKLIEVLNKFYLAKSNEYLKDFEEFTSIESKFHKNILKKKKNQQEVIDLDEIQKEKENKVLTIGFEDQQKIRQYIQLILSKCFLPKVTSYMDQFDSVEKVKNHNIIELLEIVRRFDKKGTLFKDYITNKIAPKCKRYLQTFSLEDLEDNQHKLPHRIIFPWLTVIQPEEINFMILFRRIASKLWSLENSTLFNIVQPWIKFSKPTDLAFLQNFYIAPRILYELQQFSLNEANVSLLTGLIQYSALIKPDQMKEILENTLLLQVLEAYKTYKTELTAKELGKWLLKWKKFTDKLCPNLLQTFLAEYSISVN